MADGRQAVEAALEAGETAPNYWDPTESEYHRDTAKQGIVFIVFAALTLIAFLIFFIIRIVLCTCCGKGCCARNKKPVTTKIVLLNLALCAIPIIVNFIGGAMLMASAKPVEKSLNNFFDTVLQQLDLVRSDLGNVSEAVQKGVPPGEEVDLSQLFDAEKQLDDARADIAENDDDVRHYMNVVETIIWVIGVCAFVLGAWGFVTLLARRSPFMTLFLLAAAIFGPACWLLGGAGFATKDVIDDACNMLQRHVDGELNPWVLQEARCGELLDAADIQGPIMQSANAAVREANEDLTLARQVMQATAPNQEPIKILCVPFDNSTGTWRANPNPAPGCFPLKSGVEAAEAEYGDNVCEADVGEDRSNPTYLRQCATQGKPLFPSELEQIIQGANSTAAVSKALPQVTSLTTCDFVDRAFREVLANDCPNIEHDFNIMTAAAVLAAVGITFASLYFCVCFRNLRHRRYHPGSEDDPEVNPKKGDIDNGYDDSARHDI